MDGVHVLFSRNPLLGSARRHYNRGTVRQINRTVMGANGDVDVFRNRQLRCRRHNHSLLFHFIRVHVQHGPFIHSTHPWFGRVYRWGFGSCETNNAGLGHRENAAGETKQPERTLDCVFSLVDYVGDRVSGWYLPYHVLKWVIRQLGLFKVLSKTQQRLERRHG